MLISCMLSIFAKEEPFRMFNVVPYSFGREEDMAEQVKEYRKISGNRDVLYCLPMHPEGVPAMKKIEQQLESFRKFRDALAGEDIRPGILIQSILGHWPRVDKAIEPWQRSVNVYGKDVRFCVLDSRFREYIREVGQRLAQEHPAFIMSDDDIRANCPEIECFCPLHVAEWNRRMGRHVSQEELQEIVKNGKRGDADYDAFMTLSNEIPSTVTTLLREGINAVNPDIETATCMAGRGQGMLETCKAFAGKFPMAMRITNQMYMEPGPRDYLAGIILRTMGQRAQYAEIPNVYDEADTWPHSLYSRSAIGLHAKLVSSIFCGLKGAKLWFVGTQKYPGVPVTSRYAEYLGKYHAFYQTLTNLIAETEEDGVIIPCFARPYRLHAVTLPNEQRYPMNSWVDAQFGFFGIPFYGSMNYAQDRVFALGGTEAVQRLTDDELRKILSHPVLIDGLAAKALTQRGLASLIGCCGTDKPFNAILEQDDSGRRYDNPKTASTPFLENLAPNAKILTHLCFGAYSTDKNLEKVAPGSVYFENSLGGRVVVTAFCVDAPHNIRMSDARKSLLRRYLDSLIPAVKTVYSLDDDQPEILLCRRCKDNSELLAVFNIGFDSLQTIRIHCKGICVFEELCPDGNWKLVNAWMEDDTAVLERPLPCYGTVVLRARRLSPPPAF